jgi:hypothetical protein
MSLRLSTEISLGGQRVEHPPREMSKAWRKANCFFCPLGPASSRGWFVLTRRAYAQLSTSGPLTLNWTQQVTDLDSGGSLATTLLSFKNLYLLKAERLFPGGEGDLDALYLVELVDGRYLAEKNSDTGVIQANIRSFANSTDYLTGTSGVTWLSLIQSLWNACPTLGTAPVALPGGLPIDSIPQNTWLLGLNAYHALNTVLDQLDCALLPNPFDAANPFGLVQLGSTQTVPDEADTLEFNGEPTAPNSVEAAAYLRVYHFFHRNNYGQERDTELSDNWAYSASAPAQMPTGIAGATGTLPIWDDLPKVLDENDSLINQADITTRDANRVSRYTTRWSVAAQHRIHAGLLNTLLPGGQIRATLWRNYGENTVTEFVSSSSLVTGLNGDKAEAEGLGLIVAPEKEAYSAPDFSRHSFPTYPRLPNIVQVWHDAATPGDKVVPDATNVNQVSFHKGRVKRWVSNGMATLDDCWILFVDDYDNKGGKIKATQGGYYGPARLSGVSTASGVLLPVYVVRNGDPSETGQTYVVFEVTNPSSASEPVLLMGGQANAVVCQVNPATGLYTATTEPIVIADFYRNPGMWQAQAGHRGWAAKRGDGKFDIVYMERPALFTGAIYDRESPGDSFGKPVDQPAAVIGFPNYWQHGEKVPPGPLTVYDPNDFYPRTLTGGQVTSTWNDVNLRREVLIAQQQGIYADAQLKTTIVGETEDISVDEFEIESFSPFNLKPWDIANTTVVNFLHLHGEPGDYCVLLWLEAYGKWLILAIDQDRTRNEFVTIDTSSSAGELQTGDRGNNIFTGRVVYSMLPFGSGIGDVTNATKSRPCLIDFNDYDLIGTIPTLVAHYGKIYGPAKWSGTVNLGGGNNNVPVYKCSIGDQEWIGRCSSDKNVGDFGTFVLDDSNGSPTGTSVVAHVRYNKYKANKKAIVKLLNGKLVANQVEC